jgi:hypothetical protein
MYTEKNNDICVTVKIQNIIIEFTLIKPGSGRNVKKRDPHSFDLALTRTKFYILRYLLGVLNRVLWFREFAPKDVAPSVHFEQAREWTN